MLQEKRTGKRNNTLLPGTRRGPFICWPCWNATGAISTRPRNSWTRAPFSSCPAPPAWSWGSIFTSAAWSPAARNELAAAKRFCFRAHQFYQEIHHDTSRAEVCDTLANLLLRRGSPRRALALAKPFSTSTSARATGDGEAITLGTIGRVCFLQAQYAEAHNAFLQDLAIARELHDEPGIGIMLNSLGEVALLLGQLDTARGYYQENLAADRGPINAVHAHLGLGRMHLAAGNLEGAEAAAAQMESLLGHTETGPALGHTLRGLRGAIAWRRGDLAAAERSSTRPSRACTAALRPRYHPDAVRPRATCSTSRGGLPKR